MYFCLVVQRLERSRRIACGRRLGLAALTALLASLAILYPRSLPLGGEDGLAQAERVPPLTVLRGVIQPHQPLATALSSSLAEDAIHELVQAARPQYDLGHVLPGQSYGLALLPEGTLQTFTYAIDELKTLRVARKDGVLTASLIERQYSARHERVSGIIDSNLFEAIQTVGEGDQLALDLAEIFSWDVDFNTEIQKGDGFDVITEKLYLDQRFVRYGRILAARLDRGERRLIAVRFDSAEAAGYYAPDGTPLRKAFLRSPLRFARVTSRFSNARYHPILKIVRPHRGIDYAAPIGTPVMATAGGVVVSAGWLGGYGKAVRLRHANGFTTLYGHLSRIMVTPGQRVTQGTIVGAVGRTGVATGPHLDYRMTRNGRYVNPLTVHLPPAPPIAAGDRADFDSVRDRYLSQLAPSTAFSPAIAHARPQQTRTSAH